MEIAAREVESGEGSFTERPKPFAKIDVNKYELAEFAHFLNKNLIFLATVEENGITLIPLKEGKEYNRGSARHGCRSGIAGRSRNREPPPIVA